MIVRAINVQSIALTLLKVDGTCQQQRRADRLLHKPENSNLGITRSVQKLGNAVTQGYVIKVAA